MLVEAAGDAGNENGRDKDGSKDERGGDDGTGNLLHGLECGITRGHTLLDMVLDRLDHDDGIIDDQADG